jgi:hypothetical protein
MRSNEFTPMLRAMVRMLLFRFFFFFRRFLSPVLTSNVASHPSAFTVKSGAGFDAIFGPSGPSINIMSNRHLLPATQ